MDKDDNPKGTIDYRTGSIAKCVVCNEVVEVNSMVQDNHAEDNADNESYLTDKIKRDDHLLKNYLGLFCKLTNLNLEGSFGPLFTSATTDGNNHDDGNICCALCCSRCFSLLVNIWKIQKLIEQSQDLQQTDVNALKRLLLENPSAELLNQRGGVTEVADGSLAPTSQNCSESSQIEKTVLSKCSKRCSVGLQRCDDILPSSTLNQTPHIASPAHSLDTIPNDGEINIKDAELVKNLYAVEEIKTEHENGCKLSLMSEDKDYFDPEDFPGCKQDVDDDSDDNSGLNFGNPSITVPGVIDEDTACSRVLQTTNGRKYVRHRPRPLIRPKKIHRTKCAHCDKQFDHFGNLVAHEMTHLPKDLRPLFNCPKCDQKLVSKRGLHRHLIGVHKEAPVTRPDPKDSPDSMANCEQAVDDDSCQSSFENLTDPETTVSGVVDDDSTCKRGTKTNRVRKYVRHRPLIRPKKVHRTKCTHCEKHFDHFSNLLAHELTHLPKDLRPLFNCPKCDQKLLSKNALDRHLIGVHKEVSINRPRSKVKFFNCHICDQQFFWYDGPKFRRHVESHAGDNRPRPFMCDICGKEFFDKKLLENHTKRVHATERPYQCEFCAENYKHEGNLRRHRKTCHKDLISAPKSKTSIPYEYTPEFIGPKIAYPCEFCEKAFPLRSRMTKHLVVCKVRKGIQNN